MLLLRLAQILPQRHLDHWEGGETLSEHIIESDGVCAFRRWGIARCGCSFLLLLLEPFLLVLGELLRTRRRKVNIKLQIVRYDS